MIKNIAIIATLVFTLNNFSQAQTIKESARKKAEQAVQLEDDGKYTEAIALLDEAIKSDPENIAYPYEKAYSYYGLKDYKTAIEILLKLKDDKNVFDRVYQLLGNAYDLSGESEKALSAYEAGLKLFPTSGPLYLEHGNIFLIKKDYSKALTSYENGIKNDPKFPSNYYWASKIYCSSTEKMWALIYGEIFINLERNSKRTYEISKLLFDTYKGATHFDGPGKISVSFSKTTVLTDPKKLPYSIIYEPTMALATATETKIDLLSLNTIRAKFLKFYFDRGFNKTYPNALFNYQKQIDNAGYLEAYNFWALSQGDADAFNAWTKQNPEKWQAFVKWFLANPIQIDNNNKFFSAQYQ